MIGSRDGKSTGYGVIPRTFQRLFASPELKAQSIGVSIAEIYCERVHDLLIDEGSTADGGCLSGPQSGGRRGPGVGRSLKVQHPGNADEALALCEEAFSRRRTAATSKNDRSSRSHLLVLLSINGGGRLLLADLAGAERQAKGDADRKLVSEACGINRALVALGKVVAARVEREAGGDVHVPYRDSQLTQLLEGFVGPDARTLLMAHVSPRAEDVRETMRTLTFASRAGGCKDVMSKKSAWRMTCPGAVLSMMEHWESESTSNSGFDSDSTRSTASPRTILNSCPESESTAPSVASTLQLL